MEIRRGNERRVQMQDFGMKAGGLRTSWSTEWPGMLRVTKRGVANVLTAHSRENVWGFLDGGTAQQRVIMAKVECSVSIDQTGSKLLQCSGKRIASS